MKLSIEWHPRAEAQILRMHWRTASGIAAAVLTFATSGAGQLQRVPERSMAYYLRVGSSLAILQIDTARHSVFVLAVYP